MEDVEVRGMSLARQRKRRRKDLRLKRLNAELLDAVEQGNRNEVARILEHGANPNATCCPCEVTVVHIASLGGHVDILRQLLDAGADGARGDSCNRSAIHLAAWAGHTDCLRLLLERVPSIGADRVIAEKMECDAIPQEWQDSRRHDHAALEDKLPALEPGSTPLHVACQVASLDCVMALLEAGASITSVDDCLMTPLDVVGETLVTGRRLQADANTDTDADADAVEAAPRTTAPENFVRCIQRLLDAGATLTTDTKAMGRFRATVMHSAVELGALDAIKILARAGVAALFWDRHGATPTHVAVARRLEEPLKVLLQTCGSDELPVVDIVDIKGYTALHKAVIGQWSAGVNVLLEVGADIESKTPLGETVLHLAAEKGNTEILAELLKIPDYDSTELKTLNVANNKGETPLFRAVFGGNIDCVRMLLAAKADVQVKMAYEYTVLHRAVELDQPAILELLLEQFQTKAHPLIEAMDTGSAGLTPLLMAADKGHTECVRTLLKFGCNTRARVAEAYLNARPCTGETALHLASLGGYDAVIGLLLEHDKTLVAEKDEAGWRPIHAAAFQGHRQAVRTLIANGAELSSRCSLKDSSEQSALDLIMANITRPVDFMEEALDACITNNKRPFNDQDSEIAVDYSILFPRGEDSNQLRVIDALTLSGNQHGQRTLFLHPLIASFLYLKWRKLSGFFYGLMTLYLLFVFSFTMLCTMMYYYQDSEQELPRGMDIVACRGVVVVVTAVLLLLELASVIQVPLMYLTDVETWIKTLSFVLTLVVCAFANTSHVAEAVWLRHVTTLALLLAWMQFLFLISRVPGFGSFILMFTRVTGNVIGVLLTFLFLMFGFSLTFMIQFRAQAPFPDPWNAFVKTFLMMTGEYDYSGLFENGSDGTRMLFPQIIFVVFVIFIGISMMNLLIGMAVSDITDLQVKGTMTRLKKQAEFLSMLEKVVFNDLFFKCCPERVARRLNRRRQVMTAIKIKPGLSRKEIEKVLPSSQVESILQRLAQGFQVEGVPTLTDVYQSVQTLARSVDFATGARIRPSDHIDATDVDGRRATEARVGVVAARLEALCGEVEELRKVVERTQLASFQR